MGGYIAGFYASEYPEKVITLALFNPAGVNSPIQSGSVARVCGKGRKCPCVQKKAGFEVLLRLFSIASLLCPAPLKHILQNWSVELRLLSKGASDLESGGTVSA